MLPIKVKILFAMSLSVLLTYMGILYLNYDTIPEIIPTHINFKGEIDGYGNKIHLWIATGVNILLSLVCFFLILKPKYINFPVENKQSIYYQLRIFVSILSLCISIFFSLMIFNALAYSKYETFRLLFTILILPGLFVIFLKDKKA